MAGDGEMGAGDWEEEAGVGETAGAWENILGGGSAICSEGYNKNKGRSSDENSVPFL